MHHGEEDKLRAFRNLSGVEFCSVNSLSILKLAPGGHIGRLCVWTKSAFDKLDTIFGTSTCPSERKLNSRMWSLPKVCITNTDIERLITSDEVQSVMNTHPKLPLCTLKRGNPLKQNALMGTLNPFLAQDQSVRDQKKLAWRKSLEVKLKKLEALKQKRVQSLWKEYNELE